MPLIVAGGVFAWKEWRDAKAARLFPDENRAAVASPVSRLSEIQGNIIPVSFESRERAAEPLPLGACPPGCN